MVELSKKGGGVDGEGILGSREDTDVRLSSPDFQHQPQEILQLFPPGRLLSRHG